jgi:hypothetical protein
MTSQLTSNQNKGLVWKLLTDSGAFQTIPEHKASAVKDEFDNKVNTVASLASPTDTLVTLNKRIISEMIVAMNNYKTTSANKAANKTDMVYNSSELLQQRQNAFQNELTTKKNEFERLNNVKVPDKIDFSDTLDAPIGSEMDKMLAEQIALREKQLYNVLEGQNKAEATKWLQNAQTVPSPIVQSDEPSKIKLKIGEKIDINKMPLKMKKVNFQDTAPQQMQESDNFMALLKRKDAQAPAMPSAHTQSDTISLLREILDKQNQILTLLTK